MSNLLDGLRNLFATPSAEGKAVANASFTRLWHLRQLALSLIWPFGIYCVVSRLKPIPRKDTQTSHEVETTGAAFSPTMLEQLSATVAMLSNRVHQLEEDVRRKMDMYSSAEEKVAKAMAQYQRFMQGTNGTAQQYRRNTGGVPGCV
eukprot:m.324186 g.324186  ORF g.324186 m.324186 type:complete len:147 (-) comp20370_c0_seq2:2475-2915(-)